MQATSMKTRGSLGNVRVTMKISYERNASVVQ